MSFVIVTQDNAAVGDEAHYQNVNLRRVMERVLTDGGLGEYGDATGGSQFAILDDILLLSGQYPASRYRGAVARIAESDTAAEGEFRVVSAYDPDQGEAEVAPGFSAGIVAGNAYELWRLIHPKVVLDILRRVLERNVTTRVWSVLSADQQSDQEMLTTAKWTGTAGIAVAPVVASHLAHQRPGISGRKYATITDNTRDGLQYAAYGPDYFTVPGATYHASVSFSWELNNPIGSQLTFEVREKDDQTVLASKMVTAPYFGRVWLEFSGAATAGRVGLYLANKLNGGFFAVRVDDPVFMEVGGRALPLPNWLRSRGDILGVYEMMLDREIGGCYDPAPVAEPKGEYGIQGDAGGMWLTNRRGGFTKPVVLYAKRPEREFSHVTDDWKRVHEDLVVAHTLVGVYSHLSAHAPTQYDGSSWVMQQLMRWQLKVAELEKGPGDERFEHEQHAGPVDRLYGGAEYLGDIDW